MSSSRVLRNGRVATVASASLAVWQELMMIPRRSGPIASWTWNTAFALWLSHVSQKR